MVSAEKTKERSAETPVHPAKATRRTENERKGAVPCPGGNDPRRIRVNHPVPVQVKDDEHPVAGSEELVELHFSDELVGSLGLNPLEGAPENSHLDLWVPSLTIPNRKTRESSVFRTTAFARAERPGSCRSNPVGSHSRKRLTRARASASRACRLSFIAFHFPTILLNPGGEAPGGTSPQGASLSAGLPLYLEAKLGLKPMTAMIFFATSVLS